MKEMKDIYRLGFQIIVLHEEYEGHFSLRRQPFVLHEDYEGHFSLRRQPFCPS
jgi:hypothetical protein